MANPIAAMRPNSTAVDPDLSTVRRTRRGPPGLDHGGVFGPGPTAVDIPLSADAAVDAQTLRSSGRLIRDRRRHLRLTQAELSAAMGIDRSYLAKIESGSRPCTERMIAAAARVLDCASSDLTVPTAVESGSLEVFCRSLTDPERARALEVLRSLFGR